MRISVIELTRGKSRQSSSEDFAVVSVHKWQAKKGKAGVWYAQAKIDGRHVYMHRFLLGLTDSRRPLTTLIATA